MQLSFDNIQHRTTHANRGRDFELMLERTHEYYFRQGIGKVEKISNAWSFCSEGEWRKLDPQLKARTGDGRPLVRRKTTCDYLGTVRGRGVAFDAKEFAGPSIPMANFKAHQVRALADYARVKTVAGFMLYAKRMDVVFWLEAENFVSIFFSTGLKSLNLLWLSANAAIICNKVEKSILINWASVLMEKEGL